MQFIWRNNSKKLIRDLLNMLLAKAEEFYKVRYFNKSHHHSLKLRYTQAIAFLFRLAPVWDERTLNFILHEANQTNVKYICELIVADSMDPKLLFPIIEKVCPHAQRNESLENYVEFPFSHFRSKATVATPQCSKSCTTFAANMATNNTPSPASTSSRIICSSSRYRFDQPRKLRWSNCAINSNW